MCVCFSGCLCVWQAVSAAVRSGLPGALVRCLYVFVAVPSTHQQGADQAEQTDADFHELLIQVSSLSVCLFVCVSSACLAAVQADLCVCVCVCRPYFCLGENPHR